MITRLLNVLAMTAMGLVTFYFTSFVLSCSSMTVYIQRLPIILPVYNQVQTDGTNQHESIVRLYSQTGQFFCTGSVIDANYVLTAAHCLKDATDRLDKSPIFIFDSKDNPTYIVGYAVALDDLRDVGFIKGNFIKFESIKTDFVGSLVHREMILTACGYPSSQREKFCTDLKLIGNKYFQYRMRTEKLVTIGPPIFKGMSGGPVIDKETGVLIGVNSSVDNYSVIVSPIVGVLSEINL